MENKSWRRMASLLTAMIAAFVVVAAADVAVAAGPATRGYMGDTVI